jgi:chitinase
MQNANAAPAAPLVLGYYPDWEESLPPERIGWNLFTHLAHAFATVDPDGTLKTPQNATDFCRRARAAKVKTLLSLGGAGSNKSLTAAMASPEKAARFVDDLVRFTDRAGYDGIDVDWEAHDGAADRDRLTDLVQRLRTKLGAGRLLTMAVPMTDWGGRWFDDALKPLVNAIHVMTYDMHGPWSDHAGHNAPLFAVPADKDDGADFSYAAGLAYWTKRGWPKDKILLGIPAYGRGFAVKSWYDATDKAKKPKHPYLSYKDVIALQASGWQRKYDTVAHVPYLVAPDGSERISYDDPDSAAEKAAWCRQQGVAGIFFWEISHDAARGTHTLVEAARRSFLNGKSTKSDTSKR